MGGSVVEDMGKKLPPILINHHQHDDHKPLIILIFIASYLGMSFCAHQHSEKQIKSDSYLFLRFT